MRLRGAGVSYIFTGIACFLLGYYIGVRISGLDDDA